MQVRQNAELQIPSKRVSITFKSIVNTLTEITIVYSAHPEADHGCKKKKAFDLETPIPEGTLQKKCI